MVCWHMLVQADENHTFIATSPVRKPGIFYALRKQNYFKGQKTTIYCGSAHAETATYGGWFLSFGFVAVFRAENEVGIDKNFSVGYKGEYSKFKLAR